MPKSVEIDLNAAIVSVNATEPYILVARLSETPDVTGDALPFGPFDPIKHRTLETGLRGWVDEQTALPLGYVEQLYTFGDRDRHATADRSQPHVISVGYLALTRPSSTDNQNRLARGADWHTWYRFFPWEDWRKGRPKLLDQHILPLLDQWCQTPRSDDSSSFAPDTRHERDQRLKLAFGSDQIPFDEERVLERYELLYEAGLVQEAFRDNQPEALKRLETSGTVSELGVPMRFDHRRILATAIARLRGKLKYRPVIFELMPDEFTLTDLQKNVEAIAGRPLHKQNFRRLVEGTQLVEQTGHTSTATGGRPAALYRYRPDVVAERPSPGLRV